MVVPPLNVMWWIAAGAGSALIGIAGSVVTAMRIADSAERNSDEKIAKVMDDQGKQNEAMTGQVNALTTRAETLTDKVMEHDREINLIRDQVASHDRNIEALTGLVGDNAKQVADNAKQVERLVRQLQPKKAKELATEEA